VLKTLLPYQLEHLAEQTFTIPTHELPNELVGREPTDAPPTYSRGHGYQIPSNASGAPRGSNAWVISGKHTESGQPILHFDSHQNFLLPTVWY
jgi:acyl-homoserine lactone acylase PvdQ